MSTLLAIYSSRGRYGLSPEFGKCDLEGDDSHQWNIELRQGRDEHNNSTLNRLGLGMVNLGSRY